MDGRFPIRITLWTDESSIPDWVNELLDIPGIPLVLKNDLFSAKREVEELGVVNYPTKARIEYWLHKYHEYISHIINTNNKGE